MLPILGKDGTTHPLRFGHMHGWVTCCLPILAPYTYFDDSVWAAHSDRCGGRQNHFSPASQPPFPSYVFFRKRSPKAPKARIVYHEKKHIAAILYSQYRGKLHFFTKFL